MRTIDTGLSSASAARTARHAVYAGSMLLAPILLLASTPLNPAVGGIGAGALNIAANMAADPVSNQLHIVLYEVETFLLPLGMLGMAGLLLPRSPWMATIAGGLGLMGWLPWSALTAQDDLTFQMARLGGGPQFVELWRAGRLPVEKLVSARITLDQINTGMEELADGRAVRHAHELHRILRQPGGREAGH